MSTSTHLVPNNTSPSYDLTGRSRVGGLKRIFDSSQTTVSDTQKLYSYKIINAANQESAADPATPAVPPYFAPPSVGGFIDTATTGDGCFIGVAPSGIDQNTRMLPISLDNNYEFARSIAQTKEYFLIPTGQAGLVKASGVFSPQVVPQSEEAFLVFRTNTSGTVDDNTIGVTKFPQSTWSENTFLGGADLTNGKNKSGIVLDFTKMQCLEVEFASADGSIRVGFAIGGTIHYAHRIHTTNRIAVPLTQSYNLPIRQEISRQGTKAVSRVGYFDWKNGIFLEIQDDFVGGLAKTWMKEHSVFSEAGETRGTYQNDAPRVTSFVVVDDGDYHPILSIRPKLVFNGLENRVRLFPTTISFAVSGNNPLYTAYRRGGLISGGTWSSISDTKSWEINVGAVSPIVLVGGHDAEGIAIPPGGGGTGSQATSGTLDYLTGNFLSKVDNYVELQKPLTLIAKAPSGNATVQIAVLNNSESYV